MCSADAVWRLLEPLRAEDREAFLALAHRRTYARDEILCHEGDPADSLHLVERGHLAVRGTLASGGAALGAAAYLVKPVGRGALLDAIARVVPSVQTGSRAVGEG